MQQLTFWATLLLGRWVCVFVSVSSHAGIVSQRLHGSSWFLAYKIPSTYPTLYFKDNRVSSKISLLPFGTLSQTLDLEKCGHVMFWLLSATNKWQSSFCCWQHT